MQPTPLRVERDRADFVWYTRLAGVPDLSVAARLNAGVGPRARSTQVAPERRSDVLFFARYDNMTRLSAQFGGLGESDSSLPPPVDF